MNYQTLREMWMYFFKHAEETSQEDLDKLIEQEQIIGRAYHELDRYSWNETELLTYDQAEKYEGTYIASLAQKFEDGKRRGKNWGRERGQRSSLKVAKNMLKQGFKIYEVQKATGLTKQEISSIVTGDSDVELP